MAKIIEWTPEQQAEFDDWVASRPPKIQAMVRSHPPNRLYRLTSTNQRVTIFAYGEGGTVQVIVSGQYNLIVFDRKVFGINLAELIECELPGPDEELGTALTDPAQIEAFVTASRPLVLNDAQKAYLVKTLQGRSGLGIMKCQAALVAHNWDIEATMKTLMKESRERNSW